MCCGELSSFIKRRLIMGVFINDHGCPDKTIIERLIKGDINYYHNELDIYEKFCIMYIVDLSDMERINDKTCWMEIEKACKEYSLITFCLIDANDVQTIQKLNNSRAIPLRKEDFVAKFLTEDFLKNIKLAEETLYSHKSKPDPEGVVSTSQGSRKDFREIYVEHITDAFRNGAS
jgi:hypothetical protein